MGMNPHLRSHLLAFWLSVAAVVIGVALMVSPEYGDQSPALTIMPDAGRVAWGACFALGGIAVISGLVNCLRRWEAAGSVLLGSCYLATIVAAYVAHTATPLSALFLGAIVAGFFHRAWGLSTSREP